MDATLSYVETKQPSELKKIAIGFIYKFTLEIIFFLAAAIGVAIIWYAAFHCVGVSDHQNTYLYTPYELKYFTIVIGGMKRRIAIKKYLNKKKIIITQ